MMFRANWTCGLVLIGTLCWAGCFGGKGHGTDTVPTTATVTHKGKPLVGASVAFHPSTRNGIGATGRTDDQGKAVMRTYEPGDGAIVGKFTVTVRKREGGGANPQTGQEYEALMKKQMSGGYGASTKSLIPEEYGDEKTSTLKAEVVEGAENNFEFELD